VLVAEDRSLIAQTVVHILREARCMVVGPVGTLDDAMTFAQSEDVSLDAAVLDIELADGLVYPLASLLRARGVPFLFLTGYGLLAIPEEWRGVVRIEKPFDKSTLLAALQSATAPQQPEPLPSGASLDPLLYRSFVVSGTSSAPAGTGSPRGRSSLSTARTFKGAPCSGGAARPVG
jgi:DNA-binding response OmpR family regulator